MKFHEFGDKNSPDIILIHGGGNSCGIIFGKHVSFQKNTM